MAQSLSQEQVLENVQVQKQSPIKVLQARILELSINELEERVRSEMDANPALESADEESHEEFGLETLTDRQPDDSSFEQEERDAALIDVLQSMTYDDDEPYAGYQNENEATPIFSDSTSFMDLLIDQIALIDITDEESQVLEYLIGSLDESGMLTTETDAIVDELAIYQNIYTSDEEVEKCKSILKTLEPAGIGAKDLRECLLLQIERKQQEYDEDNVPTYLKLMHRVIEEHFDKFKLKHWDRIQKALGISDMQAQYVFDELKKLNPRPGSSINETSKVGLMQVTPDFIVDTTDEGRVSFRINKGNVPDLVISESYEEVLNSSDTSKGMRDAIEFAKTKITSANNFIDAIKQRNQTLYVMMKALVECQLPFFRTGEEGNIRPMILRNLAERTGMDISTMSRATNGRYVQTRWGTFPLKKFFSEAYKTHDGEELSTVEIREALKTIIESEDKKKPYSDEKLTKLLAEKGYPIARRTVAKYREMLKIPVARLRK